MTEARQLAQRFLEHHPLDAARVLETQPVAESAAVLAAAAPETAAAVLDGMLARYASRCLAALPAEHAARALAQLSPVTAALHLRNLAAERSRTILTAMRRPQAASLRLLLRYPASAVGAWMDSGVFTLPADDTAAEAVARARREASDLDRLIYVVNRDKTLAGAVRAAELLRAEPDTPLQPLLLDVPHLLSARTGLAAISKHPGWAAGNPLPVLNRDRRLVGVLHYSDVSRGLAEGDEEETPLLVGSLMELIELSWTSMAQMLDGTFNRLSSPGRRRPPND